METFQQSEGGGLNTDEAAQLFANIFEPQSKTDKPEEAAADDQTAETKAAEDAKANPDAAQAEATDDPTVTVKIDGKEVEVKLSELTRGYQKDAAASKRFEEAATLRKSADAELQKARQERETYSANLQRVQAMLEGGLAEQQKVNWTELLETNPAEYLRQQHLAQQRQGQLQRVYAEQQRVAQLAQAEAQQAHAEHLKTQAQELLTRIPEWKDEAKAKAGRAAVREYLQSMGYDEGAIDSVSDARAVTLAHKAMLYDQMVSKAQAAAKKVSTLPTKVERPGSGETQSLDKRQAAFRRLSKSGSVDDAANVFATLL